MVVNSFFSIKHFCQVIFYQFLRKKKQSTNKENANVCCSWNNIDFCFFIDKHRASTIPPNGYICNGDPAPGLQTPFRKLPLINLNNALFITMLTEIKNKSLWLFWRIYHSNLECLSWLIQYLQLFMILTLTHTIVDKAYLESSLSGNPWRSTLTNRWCHTHK